ncbi:MAG: pyridoxamine 5'-phosphate oxidase [Sphingomicrobium sp.]
MTDPLSLFDCWFAEAQASEPNDPEAVALATSGADGQPAVRMVLMKGHGPAGFDFYTNSDSRKGSQLAQNPRASMLFHWKSLRRQVRIEGPVEAVSDSESDLYFASRGRESQLGAWASDQSRPLDSRDTFAARFDAMTAQFDGQEVPRPPHWHGYRLVPQAIEFWSDRPHRLHERRLFTLSAEGGWDERLLYP